MSGLTFVTCPTCGLPAEVLLALDETAGPARETTLSRSLQVRCVNLHVVTVSAEELADDAAAAIVGESALAQAAEAPEGAGKVHDDPEAKARLAQVLDFPDFRIACSGQSRLRRAATGGAGSAGAPGLFTQGSPLRQALAAWAWRPVWFLAGVAAALVAVRSPMLAWGLGMVALAMIPLRGAISARKAWAQVVLPASLVRPEGADLGLDESRRAA